MSARARVWLHIVACLAVSIVVSSMIAQNTALGDIAVSTSATQTQLTCVVDGYTLVLAIRRSGSGRASSVSVPPRDFGALIAANRTKPRRNRVRLPWTT